MRYRSFIGGTMDRKYRESQREESNHQYPIDTRLPDEVIDYRIARRAMMDLKTLAYFLISIGPPDENTHADIGEFRNIYVGHEGRIGDDSQLFGDRRNFATGQ